MVFATVEKRDTRMKAQALVTIDHFSFSVFQRRQTRKSNEIEHKEYNQRVVQRHRISLRVISLRFLPSFCQFPWAPCALISEERFQRFSRWLTAQNGLARSVEKPRARPPICRQHPVQRSADRFSIVSRSHASPSRSYPGALDAQRDGDKGKRGKKEKRKVRWKRETASPGKSRSFFFPAAVLIETSALKSRPRGLQKR